MEARRLRLACIAAALLSMGAVHRTPNFVVTAPTKDFAEQVGKAAEYWRDELAVAWLGKTLPKWYRPCPINVRVGQIGAGGATSFQFDRGEVFGWRMDIQGTEERILDSVLPHEINHTIFASYFRRPLPRWADEGAATLIEHESERMRQIKLLHEVLQDGTRFPLRQLFSIKEYPSDMRRVLTLYAQGYSVSDYLIQKKGRETFLKFLSAAHKQGWDAALENYYGLDKVETLEGKWNNWVMAGSPRLNIPEGDLIAATDEATEIRGQTPEAGADDSDAPLTDAPAATAADDVNVALGESAEPAIANGIALGAAADAPQELESANPVSGAATDVGTSVAGPNTADALTQFQRIGRQRALQDGWEPAPVTERSRSIRSVAGDARRSPVPRERPPFAEEVAQSWERPPFVEETSLQRLR